jgi:hypothetical protein
MHGCIEVEESYLLKVMSVSADLTEVIIPFASAMRLYDFVKSCCVFKDDLVKSPAHVYAKMSRDEWCPVAYQLGAIYYIKQI